MSYSSEDLAVDVRVTPALVNTGGMVTIIDVRGYTEIDHNMFVTYYTL